MMNEALSAHNAKNTLAVVKANEKVNDRLASSDADIRAGRAAAGNNQAAKDFDFIAAQESYEFYGTTTSAGARCGTLLFSISNQQKSHTATDNIAKALALSHWEPVIQYLEDHLDCQIDINPDDCNQRAPMEHFVHLQFAAASAYCRERVDERADEWVDERAEQHMEVYVPAELLLGASALPAMSIPEYRCTFDDLNCTLILDQFRIAAEQTAEIEPGGVVLLPSSYSAVWRGQLCASQVGPAITCEIAAQENTLRFVPHDSNTVVAAGDTNRGSKDLAAEAAVTIRMKQPLRIPADFILRMAARPALEPVHIEPADASRSVKLHSLLDEAEVLIDGELYCDGHVAPLARGMGVLVDRVLHSSG